MNSSTVLLAMVLAVPVTLFSFFSHYKPVKANTVLNQEPLYTSSCENSLSHIIIPFSKTKQEDKTIKATFPFLLNASEIEIYGNDYETLIDIDNIPVFNNYHYLSTEVGINEFNLNMTPPGSEDSTPCDYTLEITRSGSTSFNLRQSIPIELTKNQHQVLSSSISANGKVAVINIFNEDKQSPDRTISFIKQQDNTWAEQIVSIPEESNIEHSQFGYQTILNNTGQFLWISNPNFKNKDKNKDKNTGRVYLFEKLHNAWQLISTLTPPQTSNNHMVNGFGHSLAYDNGVFLIGDRDHRIYGMKWDYLENHSPADSQIEDLNLIGSDLLKIRDDYLVDWLSSKNALVFYQKQPHPHQLLFTPRQELRIDQYLAEFIGENKKVELNIKNIQLNSHWLAVGYQILEPSNKTTGISFFRFNENQGEWEFHQNIPNIETDHFVLENHSLALIDNNKKLTVYQYSTKDHQWNHTLDLTSMPDTPSNSNVLLKLSHQGTLFLVNPTLVSFYH